MRHASHLWRRLPPAIIGGCGFTAIASCAADNGPKVESVRDIAATRWLKLQTLTYRDQEGKRREWDMTTRTTKDVSSAADAVVILPLLSRSGAHVHVLETILVEQFRPPVDRKTLELPAGLIDKGESASAAALRELKEETGFVGEVRSVSAEICMSPGMCDETVRLVVVDVDLDAPANRSPKQQLDEGEYCIVRRVPVASLRELLDAESASKMAIEGLFLFALGFEMGEEGKCGRCK